MSDPRVAPVGPDRQPSDPVTPYVGKRAARRDTPEEAPATPYVGRRRATPAAAPAARESEPAAAPYVGRRAARPVLTAEPATPSLAPPVTPSASLSVPAPRRADTPAPRVESPTVITEPAAVALAVAEPLPAEATEAWRLFATESTEDTGQLPFALTEAFTGSLPRIDPEPGTDFSFDTTTALPVVPAAGRRRGARAATSRRRLRLVPSLSALAGVAAMTVAGVGAVSADKPRLTSADAGPLQQAGALSGHSAVASVGTASRSVSVSRSGGRTDGAAEQTAAARSRALDQLSAQADDQSALLKKNQWQLPVSPGAYHLTARFGEYGLWANMHTGLDFAAPTGTPIHAVSNGVITSAEYAGAYGNRTVETLSDGTELWYCHQVRFNVTPGQEVRAGDVIGYVGSTGHVTGPHVHLEVRPGGGDPVDPYPALVEHGLQP